MRKQIIYLIILITFVSLIGTIAIEYYWIRKIIRYQDQQFSGSINNALKSVTNRLYDMHQDSIETLFDSETSKIISNSELALIDSLIQLEFSSLDLPKQYAPGVIDTETGKLYTPSNKSLHKKLLNSDYKASLTCPRRSGRFEIAVHLLSENNLLRDRKMHFLFIAAALILILIGTFSFTIILLFRQKKLSAMKTDFVNNLTHEFKTPISTISLASEMMLNSGVNSNKEKIERYAKIIYDENTRLQSQVERVLQIAVLDKGDFRLRKKEVDIHEVMEMVIQSFNILLQQRNGRILSCLEAKETTIMADRVHVINIITNLLDNANKYTPENPKIRVATKNFRKGILITVVDEGIGISDENQHHVFKNLYRVPTGDLHDVKGFGMGLYYVKRIVEAHGGTIKLKSELGKGSRFQVYFPFNQEEQNTNAKKYEKKNTVG